MRLRPALALTALLLGACGGPESAAIALSVRPNPISFAGFNPGHGMITFTADWTVTVTETAGLGGELMAVATTIRNTRTGAVEALIALGPSEIRRERGTTRIDAGASATLAQSWVDSDPFHFACSDFVFNMAATLVDDHGHTLTVSERVVEAERPHPCP